MKKYIFALLISLGIPALAWGQGYWDSNRSLYTLQLATQGTTDYANLVKSQARIGAPLGKEIWVGDPNYGTTIQAAVAAIGGAAATLHIPRGIYSIASNLTIPANITLAPESGAILSVATGVTLTISGPFEAGLYQVFSCPGTSAVDFSSSPIGEVHPEWWWSGSGDYSPAIQAAIESKPSANGITVRISGHHTCNTQINVDRSYCTIVGDGYYSSQLNFAPTTANQILFNFQSSGSDPALWCCWLKDLALQGYQTTYTMTAIRAYHTSNLHISGVGIFRWTGNNNSIGIQTCGWEGFYLENCQQIQADRPIVISADPLFPTLSLDHSIFKGLNINCLQPTGKNIEVDTGCLLTNVAFEGDISTELGMYGFYWNDIASAGTSSILKFDNFRYEQPQTAGGWGIYIVKNYILYELSITDTHLSSNNGIYLRNCHATIKDVEIDGDTNLGEIAWDDLNVDGGNINLINVFSYRGTVETNSLVNIINIGTLGEFARKNFYLFAVFSTRTDAKCTFMGVKQKSPELLLN